jgi:hypothetical protein
MPKEKIETKKELSKKLAEAKKSTKSQHFLIGIRAGTFMLDTTKMWSCDKSTATNANTLMFNVKKNAMKIYDVPKEQGSQLGKQIAQLCPNAKIGSLTVSTKTKSAKLVATRQKNFLKSSQKPPSAPPLPEADNIPPSPQPSPSAPSGEDVYVSKKERNELLRHISAQLKLTIPDTKIRRGISRRILSDGFNDFPFDDETFTANSFKKTYLAPQIKLERSRNAGMVPSAPEMDIDETDVDIAAESREIGRIHFIKTMRSNYSHQWDHMDNDERGETFKRIYTAILEDVQDHEAYTQKNIAQLNVLVFPKLMTAEIGRIMSVNY